MSLTRISNTITILFLAFRSFPLKDASRVVLKIAIKFELAAPLGTALTNEPF